jgi:hypothetical protein
MYWSNINCSYVLDTGAKIYKESDGYNLTRILLHQTLTFGYAVGFLQFKMYTSFTSLFFCFID